MFDHLSVRPRVRTSEGYTTQERLELATCIIRAGYDFPAFRPTIVLKNSIMAINFEKYSYCHNVQ